LCVLFLIAWYTNNFLVTWDETLASYWLQADLAAEALLMPLLALVLILLHTGSEEPTTAVTTSSEVVIMAVSTVDPVVLVSKGMIHECLVTVKTFETSLVPVLLLVR
jgi:hypothetical protein